MNLKKSILAAFAMAVATVGGLLAPASAAYAQQKFMIVGTGGVTGVYYVAGGAVCRLVNKSRKEHGYRCSVESTGGSIDNINELVSGDIDFGVVQSDAQFNAFKGLKGFEGKPVPHLRAVMSLYPEPLTLMVRKDSDIKSLLQLKGKRVNVGNLGSGTRASVDELLRAFDMKRSDFAALTELKADEHGEALCENKIDAFFYVVGHPSANIQETVLTCGAQLVSITGPAVNQLVNERAFYGQVKIPAQTYPKQNQSIDTYGVMATVMTYANNSDEEVYLFTKSVFDNFDEFKKLHPVFTELNPEKMSRVGLSAPLHPGAARYYREKGWLK